MINVKPKIYTLKDLTETLKNKKDSDSYQEIFNKIQFGFKEIEHLCFWDSDNYSKIFIEKDNKYELVLICWEKGQKSPIHSHQFSLACTYILKGELTEEIYSQSDTSPILEKTIKHGHKNFSCLIKENKKNHRLINSSHGRSVSFQLNKK
jgi:cysteine dioxygenase